jgi:Carbohydrate esterase, sialic acid-specific acetylesterase
MLDMSGPATRNCGGWSAETEIPDVFRKWWSALRLSTWQTLLGVALVPALLFLGAALDNNRYPVAMAYYIAPPQKTITGTTPFLDLTGRVEVPAGNLSRTAVLVFAGQTSVNNVPTPYAPVNGNIDQLNIYDGKLYRAKDPLLGVNLAGLTVSDKRGTWMMRMADKLIADGHYDRVILVPMAIGNTRADQWADAIDTPFLFNNIKVVGLRMRDAGLPCTAILWGQGESDTSAHTSQVAYGGSMRKVIAGFQRAMPGCPFLVAREAYYYGNTSAPILAAQDALVDGKTVFAGENLELVAPSGRYDDTHLNEEGAEQRAVMAKAALLAVLNR